jgi:hypothetical protein
MQLVIELCPHTTMSKSIESILESFADRRRAQRLDLVCLSPPNNCSLCGRTLEDQRFLIDGEVNDTPQAPVHSTQTMGQWGFMCARCFFMRGRGIGWGTGQLYERREDGKWLLVAGFQPDGELL